MATDRKGIVMCKQCDDTRAEIWAEAQQLLAREGELYAALAEAAEQSYDDEDERARALDNAVLEAVAARVADCASFTTGGEFHHMPSPLILGIWAGNYISAQAEHIRNTEMRSRLGMGDN